MTLHLFLLIFLGAYLVVGGIALVAEVSLPGLLRPAPHPRPRPVARPRPARLGVAW